MTFEESRNVSLEYATTRRSLRWLKTSLEEVMSTVCGSITWQNFEFSWLWVLLPVLLKNPFLRILTFWKWTITYRNRYHTSFFLLVKSSELRKEKRQHALDCKTQMQIRLSFVSTCHETRRHIALIFIALNKESILEEFDSKAPPSDQKFKTIIIKVGKNDRKFIFCGVKQSQKCF